MSKLSFSDSISKGTSITIKANLGCLPFTCPNEGEIRNRLNSSQGVLEIESVSIPFLSNVLLGVNVEIKATALFDLRVSEIESQVLNSLNSFYTGYGANIVDIETNTIIKSIRDAFTPDTQTVIGLVAIAIIVLVAFYFLAPYIKK